MMAKLLSRAIRALCLGGIALGMHAAIAQDNTITLQNAEMTNGERWVQAEINYSDPEGEVGNGTEPPRRIEVNAETEGSDDIDDPVETNNFPETEVGNGTNPHRANP